MNQLSIISLDAIWTLPLPALMSAKKDIYARITELEGEISMDMEYIIDAITNIERRNIDKIAMSLEGIKKGKEAAKAMTERLERIEERIYQLLKESLQLSPTKRIDGTLFHTRLQKNSQDKITFEDEINVPDLYKKIRFTFSKEFPLDDFDNINFWNAVVLCKTIPITDEEFDRYGNHLKLKIPDEKSLSQSDILSLTEYSKIVIDEKGIRDCFKAYGKDDYSFTIPGVTRERGEHVRVAPNSKAVMKKVIDTKIKKELE